MKGIPVYGLGVVELGVLSKEGIQWMCLAKIWDASTRVFQTRIQYSIDISTKMALRFLTLRTKHVGHWSKSTRRTGSEDMLQVGSEDNASANADITQHIVSFPAECNQEKTIKN